MMDWQPAIIKFGKCSIRHNQVLSKQAEGIRIRVREVQDDFVRAVIPKCYVEIHKEDSQMLDAIAGRAVRDSKLGFVICRNQILVD